MSVFRQCGKGGFEDHVCSEGFPCPYLEGVLRASNDWSSQASVIMASGLSSCFPVQNYNNDNNNSNNNKHCESWEKCVGNKGSTYKTNYKYTVVTSVSASQNY